MRFPSDAPVSNAESRGSKRKSEGTDRSASKKTATELLQSDATSAVKTPIVETEPEKTEVDLEVEKVSTDSSTLPQL